MENVTDLVLTKDKSTHPVLRRDAIPPFGIFALANPATDRDEIHRINMGRGSLFPTTMETAVSVNMETGAVALNANINSSFRLVGKLVFARYDKALGLCKYAEAFKFGEVTTLPGVNITDSTLPAYMCVGLGTFRGSTSTLFKNCVTGALFVVPPNGYLLHHLGTVYFTAEEV